jgi:FkbM family methyltransferase
MSILTCVKAGVTYRFDDLSETGTGSALLRIFEKEWENNTFNVFQYVVSKNNRSVAIDIGAYIGLTAIWLCNNFTHTICVEADRKSVISLEKNLIASNCSNYTILNNPIYATKQKVFFGANNFMANSSQNDSTSQLKFEKLKSDDYEIESITLNDVVAHVDPNNIGFIKIDIEGGEEPILEELFLFAKRYNIPLFISFHIPWWQNTDISRFNTLFSTATNILADTLIPEPNPESYLTHNKWGSLLFEFN